MNGMHSRSKIEQYYPGMKENLLRQMYTGTLAMIDIYERILELDYIFIFELSQVTFDKLNHE